MSGSQKTEDIVLKNLSRVENTKNIDELKNVLIQEIKYYKILNIKLIEMRNEHREKEACLNKIKKILVNTLFYFKNFILKNESNKNIENLIKLIKNCNLEN